MRDCWGRNDAKMEEIWNKTIDKSMKQTDDGTKGKGKINNFPLVISVLSGAC